MKGAKRLSSPSNDSGYGGVGPGAWKTKIQSSARMIGYKHRFGLYLAGVLCLLIMAPPQAEAGDFCGSDCVLSEDFDDATSGNGSSVGTLPAGWVNVSGENINDTCFGDPCHDWWVNDLPVGGGARPATQVAFDHTTGLGNYLYVASDGNDNATVNLLTPTFNLQAANEPYATFYIYSDYTGDVPARANDLHVDLMHPSGNTVISSSLVTIGDTDIGHWRPAYVDLDGFATGAYRLRFRWVSTFDQDDEDELHDIAIDDFAVVADREAAGASGDTLEQTYILPAPENQILSFLDVVANDARDPVETYTALSIARDGIILFYDEQEDGYEATINTPIQTNFNGNDTGPNPVDQSTQIWGDGYPENGYPPGHPDDKLELGDVIILREPEIDTSPVSNLNAILDHDAGDILASTEEVAITRSFWAAGGETLNAGAVELFPVSRWGGSYELPMGQDITPGSMDASTSCNSSGAADYPFQEVALFIMADTDGTQVTVDFNDGGGSTDFQQSLDRGESAFVGFTNTINVGASVTSVGGNVQVQVFTADVGSNYGSRFYTLLPRDQFTDNYFAPFDSSSGGDGELIIYNPNASAVDVEVFTGADPDTVDTTLTITGGGFDTYVLPTGSAGGGSDATRVQSTDGSEIYVVAVMDACDDAHDWGGVLLPDSNLTSAILIPLGFGNDPTNAASGNHSPVWVTPSADTFIYVDFDGDFVPDRVDLNGDGDTNDTVDGISEGTSDQGMEVSELQLLRIHDPADEDQSGTLMFSLTTGGFSGGDATGRIAGATLAGGWGQDLDVSPPAGTPLASPSIDVGTAFAPITFPQNLPVTLSRFNARQIGSRIRFAWGTASETFTVGFNLWGKVDGQWKQLNSQLMVNRVTDSTTPQRYRRSVRTPKLRGELEAVGISSVDTDGSEHFFGPFELNQHYGSRSTPEAIPWNHIRAELDQSMRNRGYEKSGRRFVKQRKRVRRLQDFRNSYPVFNVETTESGIYRITYDQLRQAGLNLSRVPGREIALTHKGKPIPRFVYTGGGRGFGPGGYVDFYAQPVDEEDKRYTSTNVYQLQVNGALALRSGNIDRDPDSDTAPRYYIETVERDVNNHYGLNMPATEPWYEHRLIGIPGVMVGSAEAPLELDHLVANVDDPRVKIRLGLSGITEFDGNSPDHQVKVYLNGSSEPVADVTNDGIVDWDLDVPVSTGSLKEGTNQVSVEVPGVEGYMFDLVYGDTYAIDYPREFVARNDVLTFTAEAQSFKVQGFKGNDIVVYAMDGTNMARVRAQTQRSKGEVEAAFPGVARGSATYWVSTRSALLKPEVGVAEQAPDLVDPKADYIIIAHPSFVQKMQGATDFLAAKQAQGYSPHVVDVYDIFDNYGFGLTVPTGIRNYLQKQDAANPIEHVLLVGGATSDPKNYDGADSVDFVPTIFARTGRIILHTPADGLLVDLYGAEGDTESLDGIPDRSIGRWPVRTAAELRTIIDKTLAYQQTMSSRRSVMLVADATDERFPPFSAQTKKIGAKLATPGNPPKPWTEVTRVYVDELGSVAQAQQALKQGFQQGQAVTVYSGHGSTSGWSFQGLLDWETAKTLENTGLPTLVGTMSCYTTYFAAPSMNTIGHQLLLSGDAGAVLIHGAATLSGFSQNEALLGRATDAMVSGQSVGEAVQTARKALGSSYSKVITNWAVLGDPSLVIDP